MVDFKKTRIPLFRRFVLQNFPFIEQDFDALTDYELICKVVEYLNKVIVSTNATSEQVEILTDAFNELHSYVEHYFENLDVQEEINNKLDQMVEDGTLADIIQNFLNLQLSYQTVDDLKSDTAIGVGQRVICYGEDVVNDGKGGFFIITENSGDIVLDNGLYATRINNFLNNYATGISYTRVRRYDTDIYLTTIPYLDNNGKKLDLSIGHASTNPREMPQDYARRAGTTVSINCSTELFDYETDTNYQLGIFISDGEVIFDGDQTGNPVPTNYTYIGFEDDRTVHEYQVSTTDAQTMLNDDCKTVFACYWKLVENFTALDLTNVLPGTNVVTARNPRNAIGIKPDKTIIILTCDGRSPESHGLTSAEMQQIFIEQGCVKAWNLDGGRSTSLIYKGTKINRDYGNNGTGDVYINYLLDIKEPTRSKDLQDVYNQIGEISNLKSDQLTESMLKVIDYSDTDLNDLKGKFAVGLANRATNNPASYTGGYIINLPNPVVPNLDLYNLQMFITTYSNLLYYRRQENGTWSGWDCLNCKPIWNGYANDRSNDIVATNTYQAVTFPLSNSNSAASLNYISLDETKTYITVNKVGYVKFNLNATFTTNTVGTKYIKLLDGNGTQIGPVMSVKATDTNTIVPVSFVFLQPNLNIDGLRNKYHFEIYGAQDDALHRISCMVEVDR